MTEENYGGLTQLGHHVEQPASPDAARLERVANPSRGRHYVVRFTCPEFTSLCPVTGQPDFAHIVIDYIPRDWIVESKSLRLYFTSFRNHGAFQHVCQNEARMTVRRSDASRSVVDVADGHFPVIHRDVWKIVLEDRLSGRRGGTTILRVAKAACYEQVSHDSE